MHAPHVIRDRTLYQMTPSSVAVDVPMVFSAKAHGALRTCTTRCSRGASCALRCSSRRRPRSARWASRATRRATSTSTRSRSQARGGGFPTLEPGHPNRHRRRARARRPTRRRSRSRTRIVAHSITLDEFADALGRSLTIRGRQRPSCAARCPPTNAEMLHGISAIDDTLKVELQHESDHAVDGNAIAAFRAPIPVTRQAATWSAQNRLDDITGLDVLPKETTDAVVVGCGLGGLIAAMRSRQGRRACRCSTSRAFVGGVWQHTGNPHSRQLVRAGLPAACRAQDAVAPTTSSSTR